MAKQMINLFFGIAAAVLVLSITVTPAAAVENAAPPITQGPETANYTLPPEPHPGFYEQLSECLKNISAKCGEEIYLGIFKDHGTVSTGCCNSVLDIGIKCHQSIVLTSLKLLNPPPTKNETDRILNKSYLVWSKCVAASMPADDDEAPSTSPAFTD